MTCNGCIGRRSASLADILQSSFVNIKNMREFMRMTLLMISLLLGSMAFADAVVIDRCTTGNDSESNIEVPPNAEVLRSVTVEVLRDERGYYARITADDTKEVIADKVPAQMYGNGPRIFQGKPNPYGWIFGSIGELGRDDFFSLKISPSTITERKPTGYVAMLAYMKHDLKTKKTLLSVDGQRLNCVVVNN